MKGFHCPAQSIIGTRVKAAIRDLTALRGMAPNSLTEIRANRKEDPQIAARITMITKNLIFNDLTA